MSTTINRKLRGPAGLRFPSRRTIDELAERAESNGCDVYSDRFAQYAPYYIGRCLSGEFGVRCDRCIGDTTPYMVGTYSGDPWAIDDRAWFAQHPKRRWRLRDPGPGEVKAAIIASGAGRASVAAWCATAASCGKRLAIATYQLQPGKRLRKLVAFAAHFPLESLTDAGIERFCPQLAASVAATAARGEAEWQRIYLERTEALLRVTAAAVNGEALP